ncbi:MAG: carbamoyltransferase C-terminal domain-containing protein, partial [Candidatus Omnitrophota bacterium]
DSAACLVIDGQVVFAVEEERLVRKKHIGAFPERSIRECLSFANLRLADIDAVTFFWKPWLSYAHMPLFLLKYLHRMPSLWKESREWTMEENLGMLHYFGPMMRLNKQVAGLFPEQVDRLRYRFHYIEHHLCHAASAFFCSPFEEAAIMTVDGGGEWKTSLLAHGAGNRIRQISWVNIPHSLGAFYQSISKYLGFSLITGPGKLMGLASYGNRNSSAYEQIKKLVRLRPDGTFRLDLSYFSYHYTRRDCGMSRKFIRRFGPPVAQPGHWTQEQLDVAAAVQRVTEDVFLHMARFLHRRTGLQRLTIAGGVGLNSVANGRILKETPFKEIFIQPAAGDSGSSMGSALWHYHEVLGFPRQHVMKDAFLGPGFNDDEIEAQIKSTNLPYIKTGRYAEIAAALLARGLIFGWFQGRLEFGPRALGNRSILASPCFAQMKDTLNARVKFRESFRPFAPIVLEEACGRFFDCATPSPFMLLVYQVLETQRSRIPAVTHIDGSARIQTVSQSENPQMWGLIREFEKVTGVPVILNTSFNIKGEPIVCTPA